jgi:hypothetical protein
MSPKHFSALGLAALASSAAAMAVFMSATPWSVTGQGHEAVLPALRSESIKISAIEIARGTDKLALSQQDGGRWVVSSAGGYPADTQAVRKLVVAASEADLVERKTAKKDLHKLLGVADGDAGGAARTIRFLDGNGAVAGEILAGITRADAPGTSSGGTYVRRPGSDQVWLANRTLDSSTSLRDWAKTKLIDLPPESIETVSINVTGEAAPLSIVRDADKKSHKLAEMPQGKKLKYVSSIDDVVEAISLVEFKGVRKAGSGTLPPKAGQAALKTESGMTVTVDYFSDGKEAWVTISPAGEGQGKAAADDIALRTKGWEFEVPLTELSATLKKQAELLEDTSS